MGVSENKVPPYFGVLITSSLLFRVLYYGPLFSETYPRRPNITLDQMPERDVSQRVDAKELIRPWPFSGGLVGSNG